MCTISIAATQTKIQQHTDIHLTAVQSKAAHGHLIELECGNGHSALDDKCMCPLTRISHIANVLVSVDALEGHCREALVSAIQTAMLPLAYLISQCA